MYSFSHCKVGFRFTFKIRSILGCNQESSTPLITAVQEGHADAVQYLLAAGSDPNEQDREDRTALIIAVTHNHVKCTQLLMKYGADPNLRSKNGWTPLYIAAKKGFAEIVNVLLHRHAGGTVSGSADLDSRPGNMPIVAEVNAKYKNNWTALMKAAAKGHTAVVVHLIENGATVTDTDHNGATALDLAINAGASETVEVLLACEGKALFYSSQSGHVESMKGSMSHVTDASIADTVGKRADVVAMADEMAASSVSVEEAAPEDNFEAAAVLGAGENPCKRRKACEERTSEPIAAPTSSWSLPVPLPEDTALPDPASIPAASAPLPRVRGKRARSEENVVDARVLRASELNGKYTDALCGDQVAFEYLCTAAAQGEGLAIGLVSLLLLFTRQYFVQDQSRGLAFTQDFLMWLSQPGFHDSPHARFIFAVLQYYGVGMMQDISSAVCTLLQLAHDHHANAQCVLAQHYTAAAGGLLYPEAQALRWYTTAAAQDHPEALFHLAVDILTAPNCSPADQTKAVGYLDRAAARGHSIARLVHSSVLRGHAATLQCLGDCYRHGTGVRSDEAKAISCYRQSAEKGDVLGAFCLGECYKFAIGTDSDVVEEARNFKKAADQGHAEACLHTGMHHFNGTGGLEQSDKVAWKYLCHARLHGHDEGTVAQAEYMLGRLSLHRESTAQAVKLLRDACHKRHLLAHIELATHLTFTVNTEASRKEAALHLSTLLAMPLRDDVRHLSLFDADRAPSDINSLCLPFAVLFPLCSDEPDGGHRDVYLRVLASDDGTFMTEDDMESADGNVRSGRFVADEQWIQDAAPLLKLGLLHLALFPTHPIQHSHDELLSALQLLQRPWQRPATSLNHAHHPTSQTRRATCVCESVTAIDNAVVALLDIDSYTQIPDDETAQQKMSRRLCQQRSLPVALDF